MILGEHQLETSATPEAIWALLEQVGRWPEWDGSLRAATLQGPLAAGSRLRLDGRLRAPKDFLAITAEPGIRLILEARLPGAVLRRTCQLEASPMGARLLLRLELQGWLAWLQALSLGRHQGASIPAAARALARLAAHPPQ